MEKIIFDGLIEDLSNKEMKNVIGGCSYGYDGSGSGGGGGSTCHWFHCTCSQPKQGPPLVSWATITRIFQANSAMEAVDIARSECSLFNQISCSVSRPC